MNIKFSILSLTMIFAVNQAIACEKIAEDAARKTGLFQIRPASIEEAKEQVQNEYAPTKLGRYALNGLNNAEHILLNGHVCRVAVANPNKQVEELSEFRSKLPNQYAIVTSYVAGQNNIWELNRVGAPLIIKEGDRVVAFKTTYQYIGRESLTSLNWHPYSLPVVIKVDEQHLKTVQSLFNPSLKEKFLRGVEDLLDF
jgi:hypothetical protein